VLKYFFGLMLLALAACATPSPPPPNAAALDTKASRLPKEKAGILMRNSVQATDVEWIPKTSFSKLAQPKDSPKADAVKDEIDPRKKDAVLPVSFKLTGIDNDRYLLAVVEPGCHVISRMQFDAYGEWVAQGGIHAITRKPLYAEVCAEANEVTYVGDLLYGTDKTMYRKYQGVQINNGIEALTYGVMILASPSFTEKDGQILIADHFQEAQTWLKTSYPELRAPLRKQLADLGYYAGVNANDDEKNE
jgi:hypothetical protein